MKNKAQAKPGGKVRNRFLILKAEKQSRDGRSSATYQAISATTGISTSTLSKWANNTIQDYNRTVLGRLCDFFDCDISDLLVYERDQITTS